jgi:hypothetical protein
MEGNYEKKQGKYNHHQPLVSAIYKMPVNSSHLFNIMLRNIDANDVISDNGKLHRITAIVRIKIKILPISMIFLNTK